MITCTSEISGKASRGIRRTDHKSIAQLRDEADGVMISVGRPEIGLGLRSSTHGRAPRKEAGHHALIDKVLTYRINARASLSRATGTVSDRRICVRSGAVRSGSRNAARLPFRSARESHAAML
jgi:hypothetical protein